MKRYIYFFVLLMPFLAIAQSDNCATAAFINVSSGSACVTGTTVGATSDLITTSCNPNTVNDVWYIFNMAGTQNIVTVTPTGGAGSINDLVVVLDASGCGDNAIDFCGNANGTGAVSLSIVGNVGEQVIVSIGSTSGIQGSFEICVNSFTPVNTSTGDECTNAIRVCDPSNPLSITNMSIYTGSPNRPNCFQLNPTQDMWVTFTTYTTGTIAWDAIPTSNNTEFDWALYNVTSGCLGTMVCCNFNYANASGAAFGMRPGGAGACGTAGFNGAAGEYSPTANAVAGNTYAIRISNFSSNGSGFNFNWTGTAAIRPVVNFSINPSGTVCANSQVVTITDNSTSPVNWIFGNGNTFSGNNPPPQTFVATGNYEITGIIPGDCPSIQSIYISVIGEMVVTTYFQDESCPTACNGLAGVNVSNGSGNYSYQWSSGSTLPQATGLCPGEYFVTVTDVSCGTNIVEIIVVGQNPTGPYAGVDGNVTLCAADSPVDLFTYLSDNPNLGGTWSGPSATSNGDRGTLNPAVALSGTYTYFVSGGGICLDDFSEVEVLINPIVTPNFTQLGPYCRTESPDVLPAISNNGITGTWNPAQISTNTAATTVYTFTPASGQCASSQTMSIEVRESIIPLFTQLGTYCQDDTPAVLPTVSNNGVSGSWNPSVVSTANAGLTVYTFTPTSTVNCELPQTMEVLVKPNPQFEFAYDEILNCGDLGAITLSDVEPNTVFELVYDSAGVLVGPQENTSDALGNIILSELPQGTYQTFTLNYEECVYTLDTLVVFAEPETPEAPIAGESQTVCFGQALENLAAAASLGGTLSWYNDVELQNLIGTGEELEPSTEIGVVIYYVTETSNNCVSEPTAVAVTVENCERALLLPDAFTPNGDGINDVFEVVNAADFREIEMRVYNRWGQLIHDGVNGNHGWDGTFNGEKQNSDLYIFYLRALPFSSTEYVSFNAHFTLIR
jgi:gliding motility-associated-like protein